MVALEEPWKRKGLLPERDDEERATEEAGAVAAAVVVPGAVEEKGLEEVAELVAPKAGEP